MKKSIEVVAAIIIKDDLFFCAQRGYGEFIGKWEFPGGKIKENETKENALIREIKEELDADISIKRFLITIHHEYDNFYLNMHCYICELDSKELVLKEHSSGRWIKKEELNMIDWIEADIQVTRLIQKSKI